MCGIGAAVGGEQGLVGFVVGLGWGRRLGGFVITRVVYITFDRRDWSVTFISTLHELVTGFI